MTNGERDTVGEAEQSGERTAVAGCGLTLPHLEKAEADREVAFLATGSVCDLISSAGLLYKMQIVATPERALISVTRGLSNDEFETALASGFAGWCDRVVLLFPKETNPDSDGEENHTEYGLELFGKNVHCLGP
jgi:hypothetical protein